MVIEGMVKTFGINTIGPQPYSPASQNFNNIFYQFKILFVFTEYPVIAVKTNYSTIFGRTCVAGKMGTNR